MLKLQEASRYAAWEMTSHTLTDYGGENHAHAFALAREKTREEVLERFADLDSVDRNARLGMAVVTEDFEIELTSQRVDLGNASFAPHVDEGWDGQINGAVPGGLSSGLAHFGFNQEGKVQAEAQVRVRSAILPASFLDGSGGWFKTDFSKFAVVELKNRFTLIADGWDLHDGADAIIRNRRAGMHAADNPEAQGQHPLHRQVARMTYLRNCDQVMAFNFVLDFLFSKLPNILPAECGTYVVSHNYMRPQAHQEARGGDDCGYGGYPGDASAGLNNLHRTSVIDWERLKCYDTAPFRDTWTYSDSEYLEVFRARGPNFMGCEQPQADNPAEAHGTYADDENATPLECLDGNELE